MCVFVCVNTSVSININKASDWNAPIRFRTCKHTFEHKCSSNHLVFVIDSSTSLDSTVTHVHCWQCVYVDTEMDYLITLVVVGVYCYAFGTVSREGEPHLPSVPKQLGKLIQPCLLKPGICCPLPNTLQLYLGLNQSL